MRDSIAPPPSPTRSSPTGSLWLALVLAVAMLGCDGEAPAPPPSPDRPQRLPTATIRVGAVSLVVEIADADAEQRKGMMFRERLADDEAMLFVFGREANLRFWMKNTPMDLDLAYIAADGTITQVERMKAHVLDPVYSREPVRFALEVPAGWFERHGIGVGTNVAIPADVGRKKRCQKKGARHLFRQNGLLAAKNAEKKKRCQAPFFQAPFFCRPRLTTPLVNRRLQPRPNALQ